MEITEYHPLFLFKVCTNNYFSIYFTFKTPTRKNKTHTQKKQEKERTIQTKLKQKPCLEWHEFILGFWQWPLYHVQFRRNSQGLATLIWKMVERIETKVDKRRRKSYWNLYKSKRRFYWGHKTGIFTTEKQPPSLSFSAFKTSIKSCPGIVSLSIPLHSRLNSMSTFLATL